MDEAKEIEYYLNNYLGELSKNQNIILANLYSFYKIAWETEKTLAPFFQDGICVNINKLTKMTLEEKLEIVKNYFKEKEKEFDIEKYIKDGTIAFIDYNQLSSDFDFFDFRKCGQGSFYIDERNNKKLIDVSENGYVIDIPLFIHEISHFIDEPKNPRNQISDLLTETLAYAEQFIFMDYLSELGFLRDMQVLFKIDGNNLYKTSEDYKKIVKIILVFMEMGTINKENYKYFWDMQLKNDDEKEKTINDYEENLAFFKQNLDYDLRYETLYLLGYYLAAYLLNEYKKNNAFIENIKLLHVEINKSDFLDCLKLMNLQDLGKVDREKILKSLMQIKENYFKERGKVI